MRKIQMEGSTSVPIRGTAGQAKERGSYCKHDVMILFSV